MSRAAIVKKPPPFEIPGTEIGEEIGRGAQSSIFRVVREGTQYALKVRHASGAGESSSALLGLRREAAILGRLRHPGLVSIMEVGEHEGQPYLIMELAEGQTLAQKLEAGPLELQALLSVARILAGALGEIHRHGFAHRDVKPQNIVVVRPGEVKLIDFGFAQAISDSHPPTPGSTVGTLLYCSPEQAGMLKRPVDARSDLYSLGVVLFQCSTGQLPYDSKDAGQLLRMHVSSPIPDPRSLNPAVPAALAAIIMKLLSKDPDDRYQSAAGLLNDLEKAGDPAAEFPLGTRDVLHRDRSLADFAGRDQELFQLRFALKNAAEKRGTIILIEGPYGSGKTRLVREFLSAAREDARTLVVSSRCDHANPAPLAPLKEAVESHIRQIQSLPEPERREAIERIRSASAGFSPFLRQLFPTLGALLGAAEKDVETRDLQHGYYAGLADFMVQLGKGHDVVVFHFDDVQWMDDSTVQVLKHLASATREVSALVLLSGREASGFDFEGQVRIQLPRLTEEAVGSLIRSHLGGRAIDAGFITQIAARTDGNPFAINEYLYGLQDSGALVPHWGRWRVDSNRLNDLSLTSDAIQLVLQRIALLDRGTIEVLIVAALLGSRFEISTLAAVCGQNPDSLNAKLLSAVSARLIEQAGADQYAFVHDKVHEAFVAKLDAAAKKERHQEIAEVLDSMGSPEAARHFAAGVIERKPMRVFETCSAAAVAAKDSYADEEAHSMFETALAAAGIANHAPGDVFYEDFGEVCIRTNRLTEAVDNLNIALARADEPLRRAEIWTRIATVRMVTLDTQLAWEDVKRAYREAGFPVPRYRWMGLLTGLAYWVAGHLISWTGIGFDTSDAKQRKRYEVVSRIQAIAVVICFFLLDEFTLLTLALKCPYLASRLGPRSPFYPRNYADYAVPLAVMKFSAAADRNIAKAFKSAESIGDRGLMALVSVAEGFAFHFSGRPLEQVKALPGNLARFGDWLDPNYYMKSTMDLAVNYRLRGYAREAVLWAEKSLEKARSSGHHDHNFDAYPAMIHGMLGQAREAQTSMTKALQAVTRYPSRYTWAEVLCNKMALDLEQGDYGAPAEKTMSEYRALGIRHFDSIFQIRLIYLYYAYVKLELCLAATDEERPALTRDLRRALRDLNLASIMPHVRCHYRALRGALMWLEGNPEKALALLDHAQNRAEEIDSPWASFEIYRIRGRILAELGRTNASQRAFRSALLLAEEHHWLRRAEKLRRFLHPSSVSLSTSVTSQTSVSSSRSMASGNQLQLERQLKMLLELAQASSRVTDPELLARIALDEIIRLLGAERAFLFLERQDGSGMDLKIGRDQEKNDQLELRAFSSTVVEKVRSTRQAIVVTGTDEGALLGSESAVVNDLRSIMATPMLIHDRFMGVVYLDSRLAKGLFTKDDVNLFSALANYVAVSIETAQFARIEAERSALERDLAVTAAVQSLFLPRNSEIQNDFIAAAGHYQPTAFCGGDWWWHDTDSKGRTLFLLGDVSGHGPGPAMVTAAVASAYQALRRTLPDASVGELVRAIHVNLSEQCRGEYNMTLLVALIDRSTSKLRIYGAGGTVGLLQNAKGELSSLMAPGCPLASEPFQLGECERDLAEGDRLILYTDGITEMHLPDGKHLGARRFRQILQDLPRSDVIDAKNALVAKLDEVRGATSLQDDVTFVLVDVKSVA